MTRLKTMTTRLTILKGRRVLQDWEKELLTGIKRNPGLRKEESVRECRRQRISRTARRHGLTYDQFMAGLKALGNYQDREFWGETVSDVILDRKAAEIARQR